MIPFVKRYAGFFLLLLSVGGLVVLNLDPVGAAAVTATTAVATATTAVTTAPSTTASTTTRAIYVVEVQGEVLAPGRYVLAGSATVADALALAGGVTGIADLATVNLAKALYDGMVVNVPAVVAPAPEVFVYVDVKGAVRYPGVYRVSAGLRIYDAVMLAGGLASDADATTVNLAAVLADGMMIVIPDASADSTGSTTVATADDDRVDINTATVEELDTLYGIGYILAQRIIDYRAEFGPFEAIEDIMKVDGIKDSVYEAIKDDIRV